MQRYIQLGADPQVTKSIFPLIQDHGANSFHDRNQIYFQMRPDEYSISYFCGIASTRAHKRPGGSCRRAKAMPFILRIRCCGFRG